MIDLHALEIFCFSTAAVVDLALLLTFLEERNWQRVLWPVLLLMLGSSLFHGSAAVHAAFAETTLDWAGVIHRGTLFLMAGGLLLMPSALLHCTWLLYAHTGTPACSGRWFALLYSPMLCLVYGVIHLGNSQSQWFMEVFAPVMMPFMLWQSLANLLAAAGFYGAARRRSQALPRRFLTRLAWLLVTITVLNGWIMIYANRAWPTAAGYWTLLAAMTPLWLAFFLAYYMMRYQLMQLVVERSVVYAALVLVALLFHHVFVSDLFTQLSSQSRIDLALLEGICILALIIVIQPLRQRVAEALRYLLGARIAHTRDQSRQLSVQLCTLSDQSPATLATWFSDQIQHSFRLDYAAVWLLSRTHDRISFASHPALLEEPTVLMVHRSLHRQHRFICQAHDAPDPMIAQRMRSVNAGLAVLLDNESSGGVVLLGSQERGMPLNEEQRTALVLLIEQFSIALHNSELQASRIAAERQAIHNEKLSTLGLVASSIAHEIKNPLSSIKTIVTVMQEDQLAGSEYHDDLQMVVQEIDRLSQSVTGLLKFVRPAIGTTQGCDAVAVIGDTLRIMRHIADQQSIRLTFHPQALDSRVAAPENTVRDIVFNLVSNALDAAGHQGCVELSCREDHERHWICIEVRDSGPGLSPDIQARLYQPFISSKAHGTGLGLYTVGRHIHELKGNIHYHYQQGAVFKVGLPAEPASNG